MTYREIKKRLTKCENLCSSLKQKDLRQAPVEVRQEVQKQLKVLNENIVTYRSMLLKEEKTYILTPKSGKPSAASLGDDEVEALKDADDIQSIKGADGEEVKEQNDGVTFSIDDTKAIAKKVGKAVAMSLKALGDGVSSMKAHRIEENSFDIYVEYKNNRDDEFAFHIEGDTLHLADFSFDKELVDVGVKPSGEAIVHVEHLANELTKHFKSLSNSVNEVNHSNYTTPKHFDICPGAEALRDELIKGGKSPEELGEWTFLHDELFKLEKAVIKANKADERHIKVANQFKSQIINLSRDLGIQANKIGYLSGHVKKIEDIASKTDGKGNNVTLMSKDISEGPYQTAYVKVSKRDYRKAISIIDQNIDPTYVTTDIVDDDGDGNVIIYFNFREREEGDFDENPGEFIYDVSMDLEAHDITVVDKSHDLDEDAEEDAKNDADYEAGWDDDPRKDEATDFNDPVLMKTRVAKKRHSDFKKLDAYSKSPEGKAAYRAQASAERKEEKAREIVRKLKIKRAQVEREMENDPEIEPQGGPVSDMYGDQLNKIDNAIEKAASVYNKPMDYDTAVGKINEGDGELVTFGYDLDMIQQVVDHLKSKYQEGQDFELHIGRGDNLPNAVTLKNPALKKDYDLNDMLNAAQSDEDRYDAYTEGEDTDQAVGKINEFVGDAWEKRNGILYDKLVKGQGKSDTVEGEILRAVNRIVYRWGNDGDYFWKGYGTETVGPAISYLVNSSMIPQVVQSKFNAWESNNEGENYGIKELEDLLAIALEYIESKDESEYSKNTEDMFNYESEYQDEEEDDYDDYDDYDEEEDEYFQEGSATHDQGGDLDVGHQDDEPSMLKASAFETAEYAAKLVKKLAHYDKHDGEVDFPNWWQKKLILARDYMSAAFHYLDSEEKQPAIDQLALESVSEVSLNKIQKSYDQTISIMKDLAKKYKAGDKSVVDQLKTLTITKKKLEKALDDKISGSGRDQELSINESASRNLDEIFGALGYRQGFDEFIEDNPGCVEAIMEWIGSIPEFTKKLTSEYDPESLERLGFYYFDDDDYDDDDMNEDLSMKIGKVVAIKKYNVAKNQKVPVDVKITDYIKKPGSKDFVEYELKGKKRKVSVDKFKSILADNSKVLKEEMDGGRLFDYFKSKGYDITERRPDGYPPKEGVKGYIVSRGNDRYPQSVVFQHNKDTDEFTISRMSGYRIDQKQAMKAGMREAGRSGAAGMDSYMTDGNYTPVGISAEGLKDIVDHVMGGLDREGQAQSDFYKGRGNTSGTIDEESSEWPKKLTSRYGDEYEFRLVKVMSDRAKYEVVDLESGEVKGTQVYSSPDRLKAAAADLIKPQGGTRSTNLGETKNEATRQDLGMSSSISKRRAKAHLKSPSNDGSKLYGLDKDGKRVHIKSINDVDKFKKFELDADLKEDHSKNPNDKYVVKYSKSNDTYQVWEGDSIVTDFATKERAKAYADRKNKEQGLAEMVRTSSHKKYEELKKRGIAVEYVPKGELNKDKKDLKEEATCCGKCGRVHVKGNCKRPYLKGKSHCRNK